MGKVIELQQRTSERALRKLLAVFQKQIEERGRLEQLPKTVTERRIAVIERVLRTSKFPPVKCTVTIPDGCTREAFDVLLKSFNGVLEKAAVEVWLNTMVDVADVLSELLASEVP